MNISRLLLTAISIIIFSTPAVSSATDIKAGEKALYDEIRSHIPKDKFKHVDDLYTKWQEVQSGKSKAIEGWVLQAIRSGIGVGVIDPHGDLFSHLVSYLAIASAKYPELAKRTIIING